MVKNIISRDLERKDMEKENNPVKIRKFFIDPGGVLGRANQTLTRLQSVTIYDLKLTKWVISKIQKLLLVDFYIISGDLGLKNLIYLDIVPMTYIFQISSDKFSRVIGQVRVIIQSSSK